MYEILYILCSPFYGRFVTHVRAISTRRIKELLWETPIGMPSQNASDVGFVGKKHRQLYYVNWLLFIYSFENCLRKMYILYYNPKITFFSAKVCWAAKWHGKMAFYCVALCVLQNWRQHQLICHQKARQNKLLLILLVSCATLQVRVVHAHRVL